MTKKPKLSVIILNYNTEDLLKDCLNSVKKSINNDNFETIVVDNGSDDDSVALVKKNFRWAKLIENKKNLGFAAGNNIAIREARGDYILLLNPDTVVRQGALKTVLKYLRENPKVGAATCRVELPDGSLDYSCHRGFPTPWNAFTYFSGLAKFFPKSKLFAGYTATYKDLGKVHEIDALTGAFAMVNKDAGEAVGWLDEDYFWNGEDIDFCYKLKRAGWKIVYIPDVKIIHYKGSASGLWHTGASKPTKEAKSRAALSGTQVMRLFYKKHLAYKYPFFINAIVYLGISLLETLRSAKARTS